MSEHGGNIYEHPNVLDFSANCNCYGMPEAVRLAARAGVDASQVYPDEKCSRLREAIGVYESVDPSQVLCGSGASQLLLALALALRPKRALLVAPDFGEYERVLEAAGTQTVYFDSSFAEQFGLNDAFFSQMKSCGAQLVMLSNPNNPTGVLRRRGKLKKLLTIAAECRMTVVVDECFLEFAADAAECSVIPFLHEYPNLVVVRAFTKTYACAGLRIGYLLCRDEKLLARCCSLMPAWSVSQPAAMAGIAAANQRAWLKETAARIAAERDWLRGQLIQLGCEVSDAQANYLFFFAREGLYESCLAQGILIRDCSSYRTLGAGAYRVCVRLRAENEQLLRAIRKGLEE